MAIFPDSAQWNMISLSLTFSYFEIEQRHTSNFQAANGDIDGVSADEAWKKDY
jgi:hypothetical protein